MLWLALGAVLCLLAALGAYLLFVCGTDYREELRREAPDFMQPWHRLPDGTRKQAEMLLRAAKNAGAKKRR